MARSSYVYVVVNDEGMPWMAFTVKHELVSWLRCQGEDVAYMPAVFRMPDGREREQATEMDILELIA